MKKISLLLSAMLLGLFAFTSCDNDDDPGTELIEDGIYVLIGGQDGDMETNNLMGAGTNEADENAARSGMYEKYIALEANTEIALVKYTAGEKEFYGATLAEDPLGGDNEPETEALRGNLVIGTEAPTMSVSESGLYHIVLDLNTAGDLSDAQIIIARANWGMRGAMNGWGNTYFDTPTFNAETMTYTMTEVTVSSSGQFKFAYGGGWKIELDDAGEVKANTNLGNDADEDGADFVALLQGGKNFAISKGVYTISLTWTLTAGAIANSFSYNVELTQELSNTDWSDITLGIIGDAITNEDASGWTAPYLAAVPTVDGEVYTYTMSGVELGTSGGFKFKTSTDGWYGAGNISSVSGDASDLLSGDDNYAISTAGTYDITIVIDAANDDTMTMTINAAS